jgi:hypothetical protein
MGPLVKNEISLPHSSRKTRATIFLKKSSFNS